jgi:hypothetical protein
MYINFYYSEILKKMEASIVESIKNIFKVDQTTGISTFRNYLLRFFFALIAVLLGFQVWSDILTHQGLWQPLSAVAVSFWAAFSLLAILGILHPLKMLPLLLVQISYKLIWLIIVAYPLWSAQQLTGSAAHGMTNLFSKGIIIDVLVIPWPYVLKNYIFILKKNKLVS